MAGQPDSRRYCYAMKVPVFSAKSGAQYTFKIPPKILAGDGDILIACLLTKVTEAWVGLATSRPYGPEDNWSLADFADLELPPVRGYRRLHLGISDWRVEGDVIFSKTVFFENLTLKTWPGARAYFLASSPDDSGALLAWRPLATLRSLMPGDGLQINVAMPLVPIITMEVNDEV